MAVVSASEPSYRPCVYEQNSNITYYAVHLEDLRAWHVVVAICGECRHQAPLHHRQLVGRRAPLTRLRDLEPRLRCQRCGNNLHNRFSVRLARRD